jgi:hypothetical protein
MQPCEGELSLGLDTWAMSTLHWAFNRVHAGTSESSPCASDSLGLLIRRPHGARTWDADAMMPAWPSPSAPL